MAKKRGVAEEESSSGSEADEQVDEQEQSEDDEGSDVEVDFMAKVPHEDDFHGIRALLRMLFRTSTIDLSGLSDLIINQPNFSSVVKLADDTTEVTNSEGTAGASASAGAGASAASAGASAADDEGPIEGYDATESKQSVYGMMTAVDVSDKKAAPSVQQVVNWALSRCADKQTKEKFTNSLSKGSCGLVLSERFTNIPFHVSIPLYKTLLSDLADNQIKFDHVWMITKLYESTESMGLESLGPGPQGRKKKKESVVRYYINPEDELFEQSAIAKYTFSVTPEEGLDTDTKLFRTVLLLPMATFEKVIHDMETQFQVAFTMF